MRNLPFFEKNRRRAMVYGPRAVRMIMRGGLAVNCCFVHIPKSGGTSVTEALQALAPIDRHVSVINAIPTRRAAAIFANGVDSENDVHEDGPNSAPLFALREQMLLAAMAHDDALIHGHALFSEKAHAVFGDRYKFVTVLRDPFERVISNYKDAKRAKFFTGDFDAYIASGVARRHAQLNLRYFSGVAEVPVGEEAATLTRALDNMRKFAIVGFLDRLDSFRDRFGDVFGVKPRIHHYNVGASMPIDITAEQKRAIERLAAEDYAIHEAARATWAAAAA